MKKVFLCFCISVVIIFSAFAQRKPMIITGYTQGTTYRITYFDKKKRNFQTQIEEIFLKVNASVSLYEPSSIISKVNRNDQNVKVDDIFKNCFIKALQISDETRGMFDITVGPLVKLWGFGLENKGIVDSFKVDSILTFIGYKDVVLYKDVVIKKDERIQLDFNALAQGYTVDLVAGLFDFYGIQNYLIEIGGEVFAKGEKSKNAMWQVGIEKPDTVHVSGNQLIAIVRLKNMALATSGSYRKFFIENGKRYAHTINPMTGYPSYSNLLSVSVFAPRCIDADAYATAFMVMGFDESMKFLETHPEIQVFMIYVNENQQLDTYYSSKIAEILDTLNRK